MCEGVRVRKDEARKNEALRCGEKDTAFLHDSEALTTPGKRDEKYI